MVWLTVRAGMTIAVYSGRKASKQAHTQIHTDTDTDTWGRGEESISSLLHLRRRAENKSAGHCSKGS